MSMQAIASSAISRGPWGSNFTDEGVLQSSGVLYNGAADLRFILFSAA